MDKKESQNLISFSDFAKFSTIGSPLVVSIRNIISGNKINTSNESQLQPAIEQLTQHIKSLKQKQNDIIHILLNIDKRIDAIESKANNNFVMLKNLTSNLS